MSCGVGQVRLEFEAHDPEVVRWVEQNAARLIVEVGEETRAAVRGIIALAFEEGLPPKRAAKLVREVVGLTSRQAQAVANLRARLDARGIKADVLDRRVARYAERLRRQRALTIARTESMRAANEGQRQQWRQARDRGYLNEGDRRQWVATPDERTCPVCWPLRRATAPINEDVWTRTDGVVVNIELPAHPNCRCTAVLHQVPASGDRVVGGAV